MAPGPRRGRCSIARTLGWYCCIVDHREALLRPRVSVSSIVGCRNAPRRPCASSLPSASTQRSWHDDARRSRCGLEALRALAGVDIKYIGLLGPAGRRDELFARLSAPESDALKGRLHVPVGLPLGGKGPEAIALSIAAELQKLVIGHGA